MKTKLLLILLLIGQITLAQNLVISEIMVNPSGSDSPHEYIELRGDPGATIAADTYLIQVEGDSGSNPGDIESNGDATNGCTVNNDGSTPCPQGGIIDLSGVTIGSNGYVVILTTGHDYTVDPNATALFDVTDGDLEGQSHSFLLINTNGNGAPSSSDDIDADDDGEIDAAYTSIWTFIDGVAFIDDDSSTGEIAYADVIFAESAAVADLKHPSTATVISTSTQYDYAARVGNSTGSNINNDASVDSVDWVGGDVPSSTTSPRLWVMGSSTSSVRTHPESWEGSELNHIGSANPTQSTLSLDNFSDKKIGLYPNPSNSFVQITSELEISSIQIFNVLGERMNTPSDLSNKSVDISALTKGIYILKISSGTSSLTKKIIKN